MKTASRLHHARTDPRGASPLEQRDGNGQINSATDSSLWKCSRKECETILTPSPFSTPIQQSSWVGPGVTVPTLTQTFPSSLIVCRLAVVMGTGSQLWVLCRWL